MNPRRRILFALAAGAFVHMPANAQSAASAKRIGYLDAMAASDQAGALWLKAFTDGLGELGWVQGRNVTIEYLSVGGKPDAYAAAASEMGRRKLDVIVTAGEPLIRAAQKANPVTPIVMVTVGDPVGAGFAKSLARPGGKITGMSTLVTGVIGKWLELLREVAPRAIRMAVVRNLANPTHHTLWGEAEAGASKLGLDVFSAGYRMASEFEQALDDATRKKAVSLLVLPDPIVIARSAMIAEFALRNRLLTAFLFREHVVAGGLMSYGPSRRSNYRRAAIFVDKILRGADPAELPIEQAREFELVVNLRTARALGFELPAPVLLRATEVIE